MKLGADKNSIFLGYDVVDNHHFNPALIKKLEAPVLAPYFLTINRFIERKNLHLLLHAYSAYRKLANDEAWDLVLCGDGELKKDLLSHVAELGLLDHVHLPGFLQYQELLPYFAHAKCFIHASLQEQWGLVVNEAMAAALPVLVSNRCGCFDDLVLEGINGFGFDPENSRQLTDLMFKISSGHVDLDAMGSASLQHIQKYSPDYFAEGLFNAVNYALKKNE